MKLKSLAPVLFAAVLTFTLGMQDADAKRLGSGGSMGRQSQSLNRGQASPAPTAPTQAPQAAPRPSPTPAPASPGNRWLGPIAGLAAGLGIAALLSHFGMGGALADTMGSMLLIAGLIFAAFMVWRLVRGRGNADTAKPAFAGAGANPLGFNGNPGGYAQDNVARFPDAPPASAADAAPAQPNWSLPADMDVAAFTHSSKVLFLRLQAASDAGNLADIREFTTPEMYAEIQLEIDARNGAPNQTEVFKLEAQTLGVEELNGQALASVRFSGTIREEAGADAQRFSEVWNFAKAADGRWLLAGIQQNR